MPKKKTSFQCSACGYENPRWMGKCPACGAWNTMDEIMAAPEEAAPKAYKQRGGTGSDARPLKEIETGNQVYISSGLPELDRVLGGGIVEGSLMLVGGDPGIGKSTLLTQVSANFAAAGRRVLYVSGEESTRQIKLRARRLAADAAGQTETILA